MKLHTLLAASIALVSVSAVAASGDAEAGRKKSQPCQACHGQNEDYLVHALKHYKNGKRKNPIMQAQAANLSDKDILDLAAHFSHEEGLQVKY